MQRCQMGMENFQQFFRSIRRHGEFSYPIPGTGTAGKTCNPWYPVVFEKSDLETECGELKPGQGKEWAKLKCSLITDGGLGSMLKKKQGGDVNENAEIKDLLNEYTDPRDLPCNWNKIKHGETVQIPLYGSEGALSFTEFKLRVRTPCKAVCDEGDVNCEIPELCGDGDRYVVEEEAVSPLPPGTPEPVKYGEKSKTAIKDTLVLWSIEDGECNGLLCFLSNMVSIVKNQGDYEKQKASLITANHIQKPTLWALNNDLNERVRG